MTLAKYQLIYDNLWNVFSGPLVCQVILKNRYIYCQSTVEMFGVIFIVVKMIRGVSLADLSNVFRLTFNANIGISHDFSRPIKC